MNTLTKTIVAGTIMGTLGIGSLATASIVGAESAANNSDNPQSSLIEKIASTFNIDKSKLQTIFDEDREAREAAREKEQAAKLQTLVDNGTITSAQKTVIEKKIAELKSQREANCDTMKDLTDDERKAKMDEERTALEAWAKEQALDLSKLKGVLGGGPGGHGGPRG